MLLRSVSAIGLREFRMAVPFPGGDEKNNGNYGVGCVV